MGTLETWRRQRPSLLHNRRHGGEGEASELDGQETARWQAVGSAVRALGESLASGQAMADDVAATFAQLRQIPLDHERILNAMHVPEDAEEYRETLAIVLRRIPDGWGRWIGCDRGWYPIITELDAALAQLCPDYEVHQIKEKVRDASLLRGTMRPAPGSRGRVRQAR